MGRKGGGRGRQDRIPAADYRRKLGRSERHRSHKMQSRFAHKKSVEQAVVHAEQATATWAFRLTLLIIVGVFWAAAWALYTNRDLLAPRRLAAHERGDEL